MSIKIKPREEFFIFPSLRVLAKQFKGGTRNSWIAAPYQVRGKLPCNDDRWSFMEMVIYFLGDGFGYAVYAGEVGQGCSGYGFA